MTSPAMTAMRFKLLVRTRLRTAMDCCPAGMVTTVIWREDSAASPRLVITAAAVVFSSRTFLAIATFSSSSKTGLVAALAIACHASVILAGRSVVFTTPTV